MLCQGRLDRSQEAEAGEFYLNKKPQAKDTWMLKRSGRKPAGNCGELALSRKEQDAARIKTQEQLRNRTGKKQTKNQNKPRTSGKRLSPSKHFFFFFIGVPDSTAKVWGKGFAPRLLTHPADKLRQPSQPLLLTQLCFP